MAEERGYVAGGMHGWGEGCAWLGVCMAGGHAWLGCMCGWEVCKADTMGTAYGQ